MIAWSGTWVEFRYKNANLFLILSSIALDEINKHMQDLSVEFEDLFDPYLPVSSKLKIKTCPALGVSEMNANQTAII